MNAQVRRIQGARSAPEDSSIYIYIYIYIYPGEPKTGVRGWALFSVIGGPEHFFLAFFRHPFLIFFGALFGPPLGAYWSFFLLLSATVIFNDFRYIFGLVLGSASTLKVSILLRTSFKNHKN